MYAKNAWQKYEDHGDEVMSFNEDYKRFISQNKTERACVKDAIEMAKNAGFQDISCFDELKTGDKVYVNNRGKNIALFIIGQKPLYEGMRILGAHIDSLRMDLKQNPLYEADDFALLDTHYYGGIKKYQWVTIPLSLYGVVVKKDGTVIDVVIGEDDNDPVVGVSDLLVHLSGEQLDKKAAKVIEGENLDITVGSMPLKGADKDAVKANILKLLKDKYDMEEEDFLSAEIEVVPSGPARDYGLDRSMVAGYGHDDRVCAFTSLKAILDIEVPDRTACCILVDKEEVGSQGNSGMQSRFFENVIAKIMAKANEFSPIALMDCLSNSKMLSSDVSAAFDPNYPSVNEPKNTAYFGKGLCLNKYTGSRGKGGCNDANPEFIAQIRKVMDDNDVMFQTSELGRVDQGGGGTIAYILANLNVEVIDAGIAVQNMHSQYEVVSKADVYEGYRGYKAFLKDIK